MQRLKDYDQYTPEGEPVLDTFAEVQQRWHLWRRRYDLFIRQTPHRILSTVDEPQPEPEPDTFQQFAEIDGGILAWHFTLRDAQGLPIASVNRAFRGFGREVSILTIRRSSQGFTECDYRYSPTLVRSAFDGPLNMDSSCDALDRSIFHQLQQ